MTKYSDLGSILHSLQNTDSPNNTWRRFFFNCFLGFALITMLIIFGAETFNKIFPIEKVYRPYVGLGLYLLPLLLYLLVFILSRAYSEKIRFSQKTNIVLAYNCEGINQEKFNKKYKFLVKAFENEINSHDLGNEIKLVVCPYDISLRNKTAAEAMTKLSLVGSTLLVWGHIVKDSKTHKHKFVTRFSYEFGYSKNTNLSDAKKQFSVKIEEAMTNGLLNSMEIDTDNFVAHMLPAVFYILGMTTFSLKLFEKSEMFLKSFIEVYRKEDLLRKRDLGFVYKKAKDYLILIAYIKFDYLLLSFDQNKEEIKSLAEEVLSFDDHNYDANVILAYYYEHTDQLDLANDFHTKAVANAKHGFHNHIFNEAYFALKSSNFLVAINAYNRIPEVTNSNVTLIVEDLNRFYERTKNPAFLFAEAYINYRWIDVKRGKKQFKQFLKMVNNSAVYSELANTAKNSL